MSLSCRLIVVTDEPARATRWLDDLDLPAYSVRACIVSDAAEFDLKLKAPIDLILCDQRCTALPVATVLRSIAACDRCPPVIVIADEIDAETAIDEMREGVVDYVFVDRLFLLGSTVARVLERQALLLSERESQMRVRALIENASDVVAIVDPDGMTKYVSQSSTQILGMPPDELVGFSAFNRIHPDEAEAAMAGLREAAGIAKRGGPVEFRYRKGDDTWTWLEAVGANLLDDPYVSGLVVTARDISARKAAEDARRQKEEWFSSAFAHSPIGMALVDLDGAWLHVNQALCDITGYSQAELVCDPRDHDSGVAASRIDPEQLAELIRGDVVSLRAETKFARKDGSEVWTLLTGTLLPGMDGAPEHVLLQILDINEQKQTQLLLVQEQEILRNVMDNIPDSIYLKDLDGRFTRVNKAVANRFYGVPDTSLVVGKTDFDIFAPEWAAEFAVLERNVLVRGESMVSEPEHSELHGKVHWHLTTKIPIRDKDGHISGLVGVNRDITAIKQAEEQIQFQAQLLEHVGAAVMVFDLDGVITRWNRFAEALFGWSAAEALGKTMAQLQLSPIDLEVAAEIAMHLRRVEGWEGEFACRRRDGVLVHARASWAPVRTSTGEVTGFVSVALDVSERAHLERELRRLAQSDPLTGLPNRIAFAERLSSALDRVARRGELLAVLFLDLDRFKLINDSLGHDVGDQLLISVADRLVNCVRGGDIVGRFGGDEFTILLEGVAGPGQAKEIASRLLNTMRPPFRLNGNELSIGASIGIALSDEFGGDPGELLRRADIALYRSKADGRGRYSLFQIDELMPAKRTA